MSSSLDMLDDSVEPAVGRNARTTTRMEADSEDLLASGSDFLARTQGTQEGSVANATEEEEELSPKEVIQRMQTAWLNERFAPCLLPPQTQVVDCLLDQITQMERNLSEVRKADYRVSLHKMELARVRFLVASYLRLRLKKIEQFAFSLDLENGNLSKDERAFAKAYRTTAETHFHSLALRHMPGDFIQMPTGKKAEPRLPEPNMDAAVFVAVERDVQGVMLEDETMQGKDEELDMAKGEQHIVRYKSVADLVQEGVLKLI